MSCRCCGQARYLLFVDDQACNDVSLSPGLRCNILELELLELGYVSDFIAAFEVREVFKLSRRLLYL